MAREIGWSQEEILEWQIRQELRKHPRRANSVDPDAQAFFDVVGDMTTSLYSNATAQAAVIYAIGNLKVTGVWDRQIDIGVYLGGTGNQHRYNLKNPQDTDEAFRIQFAGGWVHDEYGSRPDGVTGYGNTFINPNIHLSQYSFHGAVFSRLNEPPDGGDHYIFGGADAGTTIGLDFYATNRMYAIAAQQNTGNIGLTSQTEFNKLIGINTYHFDKFNIMRDGVSIGSNTDVRDPNTWFPCTDPNNTVGGLMYLGALNLNGTPFFYSTYQYSFHSFGYALSDQQWLDLNTTVNIFQTMLGRPAI